MIRELRLAYYQMTQSSQLIGLNVKGISGAYGLMADLYHQGPKTIPKLLEDRAISRQYLHRLVRTLQEEGLLKHIDNPDHQRSKLITLTDEGLSYFLDKKDAILETIMPIASEFSEEQLETAVESMIMLRKGFKNITENRLKESD